MELKKKKAFWLAITRVLFRQLTERKLPRDVGVFSYVHKEGNFWPVRTARKLFLKNEHHPDEV